jgi:hypothetical protein
MDATRLAELLDDLEIEATAFEENLTELAAAYTLARDNPSQDSTAAIAKARDAALETLTASETNTFVPSRRQMMQDIDAYGFFGTPALERLNEILTTAASGPAGVVRQLETFKTELHKFRVAATSTRKGLANLNIQPEPLHPGECEVGVLIPNEMVHWEVKELSEVFRRWNQILRTFMEVAGEKEREATIRTVATGSYELFVLAGCTTAGLLSHAIDKILGWYKQILEIQLLRKKLGELGVPTAEPKAAEAHEKEIIRAGISDLAKELLERTPNKLEHHRRNELQNELVISITRIVSFVDRGGDVEVSFPRPVQIDYEPPAEDGLQSADENKLRKEEWEKIEDKKYSDYEVLRNLGAGLASLPPRPQPILQLGEGVTDDEGAPSPEPTKKKQK